MPLSIVKKPQLVASIAVQEATKSLHIIDTCVLVSDSDALFAFEEHDIHVPLVVIEELDRMKTNDGDKGYHSRRAIRTIESLTASALRNGKTTISLSDISNGVATGNLIIHIGDRKKAISALGKKADSPLLRLTGELAQRFKDKKHYSSIILVSQDCNLRLQAMYLHLDTEDYLHDVVDVSYKESIVFMPEFFDSYQVDSSFVKGGLDHFKVKQSETHKLLVNTFIHADHGKLLHVLSADDDFATLRAATDFCRSKNKVCGLTARKNNLQQSSSFSLMLDPDIGLVTLEGPAGTGKTLIAVASGIQQVIDGLYDKIIYIKSVKPVDEKEALGFLPGEQTAKFKPWTAPVYDALDVINASFASARNTQGNAAISSILQEEKLQFEPIQSLRGRSLYRTYIIVDETQNLSRHVVKTLASRVGEGSKIVFLGDITQIDDRFLNSRTSGMAHVISKTQGMEMAGHITLLKCERSAIAEIANTL